MSCNVAVIGAGLAGVTAAATLAKHGVENVRVFEATERIGGRLENYDLTTEISVNLGANWMSGDKNPILLMLQKDENVTTTLDCKRNTTRQEQAEENDVKIFNRNFENITDVYRDHSIVFKNAQEKCNENYFSNRKLLSLEKALEKIGYEKPDEYLYKALQYVDGFEALKATTYDETSTGVFSIKQLRNEQGEGEYMTSDTGACLKIIASDGGFDLKKIELKKEVIKISKNESTQKFQLVFSDGSIINSDYVISSVPISMYQRQKLEIEFLTETVKNLLDSISFVNFANCWVLIDEEDEKRLNTRMFYYLPTSTENPFRSVQVCQPCLVNHNRKILIFRTVGEDCVRFNKMTREEVESSIKYVLKQTMGFSPKVLNFSQPKWSQKENFLGCYSNAAVNENMTGEEFYNELNRPMTAGFYFAGEAFDFVHAGQVTAAYKTGLSTALDIISEIKKK